MQSHFCVQYYCGVIGVAISAENLYPILTKLPDTSKRLIESTTVTSVDGLGGVAAQAAGRLTKYSQSRAVYLI